MNARIANDGCGRISPVSAGKLLVVVALVFWAMRPPVALATAAHVPSTCPPPRDIALSSGYGLDIQNKKPGLLDCLYHGSEGFQTLTVDSDWTSSRSYFALILSNLQQAAAQGAATASAWVDGIGYGVYGALTRSQVAAVLRAMMRVAQGGTGPVTITGPVTTGPPTITGTARAGGILSCSGGSVTVHATSVVYQWVREGTPIPGAANRLYKVRKVDEGLMLTCLVTAYAGGVVTGTATSAGVSVAVPVVSGCPAATGALSQLARLLGRPRAEILRAFARNSSSGQDDEDSFCLTPFGVLVGYPTPGLLAALPAGERGTLTGRAVWISTANAFYSVLGVRPGTTIAAAAGAVPGLTGPFRVGLNVWYLAQEGSYVVVLIIRGGIVVQVGVADGSLAGGQGAEPAVVRGLETIYRQSTRVSGPLEALDAYWAAIGAHNFFGATRYVLPGVLGSTAAFVTSEQHEHVQSAQFQGSVTSRSGSGATVRVVSLITHDRQFGCRTWSGTYAMTHRGRGWLIARASLHPRRCGV